MTVAIHVITEADPASRPRLGRHIEHHAASIRHAAGVAPKVALKSVVWTRRTTDPVFDQGQLGSCTGNALTAALGTDSLGRTASPTVSVTADSKGIFAAGSYELNEDFAVKAYTLNTWLDSIPGHMPQDDTGSSGVACGKTGQQLGLLKGYTHAFSYSAMVTALQSGPVLIGIPWYNSMFDPESDGHIPLDESSGLAGGHELLVREYDAVNDRVWPDNSWGTSWGVNGRGYIKGADMKTLLAQNGDVTVPLFAGVTPPPAPSVDPAVLSAYTSLRAWAIANGVA
ncbi:MAG: hypothetical protein EPO09_21565 [Aquabacterium sp.]|uniref:hypothetical protein n=1 Tax=Aquabacterium sp. TaxID=1872578 RepID=UPI00122902FF|nr:hypothetical protein [Aquabacterium sp.]TAK82634.1 MAG: hypothetical protein EPO09_21565 [Aquabacterium sp.]